MRLISLNIWGGKLFGPLTDFLKAYSNKVDFFCFQEVYHSSFKKEIGDGMPSNVFLEISNLLSNFRAFFAPTFKVNNSYNHMGLDLSIGLAIFVRKTIPVRTSGDIFIYGSKHELIGQKIKTMPRNLQYLTFTIEGKSYLLCHFHGIWHPKTKVDTKDRLEQSKKIKKFLNAYEGRKILCGDFNLLPNTKSMLILEKGMRNLIKESNISTTRNSLYKRKEKYADYILISQGISVRNFKVIDLTVSDHLPLFLDFQ